MSLFLAVPVPPELFNQVQEQVKQAIRDVSTVQWFDAERAHLTLIHLGDFRPNPDREQYWADQLKKNDSWMDNISATVEGFSLTLNQITVLGYNEAVIAIAMPEDWRSNALSTLLRRSRKELARVMHKEVYLTQKFRPHVTLGLLPMAQHEVINTCVFNLISPKSSAELRLLVNQVTLYRKSPTSPNGKYIAIETGNLLPPSNKKAPK